MTPSAIERLRVLATKGPVEPMLKRHPQLVYCALYALAVDSGSTEFDAPYPLLSEITGLTYEAVRRTMDRLYQYRFVIRITHGAGTHTGYHVRWLSPEEAAAARQGQANVIAMPTKEKKTEPQGVDAAVPQFDSQVYKNAQLLEPLFKVCIEHFGMDRIEEIREQVGRIIVIVAAWISTAIKDSLLYRAAEEPGFVSTVVTSVLRGSSPLHTPDKLPLTRHAFDLEHAHIERERAKNNGKHDGLAARRGARPSRTG